MLKNLKLRPLAIGSLPHNDSEKAMSVVTKDFSEIPFFPQLANVNRKEDMIFQVLEGMPAFSSKNISEFSIDSESEEFYNDLEEFFSDYEEILENPLSEKLDKYGISNEFSSTFDKFLKFIEKEKPLYAKAQIVGPFTLSSSITDKNGVSVLFDETLRDIVVKLLSLKAVWIIRQIKSVNSGTTPIIFTDEPTISQMGTSAYMTISEADVCEMLSQVSGIIQKSGGLSGIHCCGKCDWSIPINAGYNIINPDGYSYAQHFSLYSDNINKFLNNGGKIVWGIVPTLDDEVLKKITVEDLVKIFETSVNYLTKKGINEKLITDNSLISSSCGAGSLTEELSQRAMDLIKEVSDTLRERF